MIAVIIPAKSVIDARLIAYLTRFIPTLLKYAVIESSHRIYAERLLVAVDCLLAFILEAIM